MSEYKLFQSMDIADTIWLVVGGSKTYIFSATVLSFAPFDLLSKQYGRDRLA